MQAGRWRVVAFVIPHPTSLRFMRRGMDSGGDPNAAVGGDPSAAAIGATGSTSAMSATEELCTICLEPLDGAPTSTLTGCSHVFHSACIVPALQHNRSCPLCRYVPQEPDLDYDEGATDTAELRSWNRRRRSAMTSVAGHPEYVGVMVTTSWPSSTRTPRTMPISSTVK